MGGTRLDDAPDGLLAARASDGDEAAFGVLVRRHAPFLRAFAIRYLGSTLEADDVVQEALVSAWNDLSSLREPSKVRSWLATAVARRATDALRKRARRGDTTLVDAAEPATHEPGPAARAERSAATAALASAVDELPAEQREVWLLREMLDLRYDEIAARVGCSSATVRGRLARARTQILAAMEEWR